MAKSAKKSRSNGRKSGNNKSGPVYIPQANILNLKEIYEQEEKAKEKKSIWSRFKRQEATETKTTEEVQGQITAKRQEAKQTFTSAKKKIPVTVSFPAGLGKSLAGFFLACLLILSPIYFTFLFGRVNEVKGKVLGVSFTAYNHLQSAQEEAKNLNINKAQESFVQATASFQSAQDELSQINSFFLSVGELVPGQGAKVKSGRALLKAGQALAEAGTGITTALAPLLEEEKGLFLENQDQSANLVETLLYSYDLLQPALLKIKLAGEHLKEVDISAIPQEYQSQIKTVLKMLPEINQGFSKLTDIMDVFLQLLGQEQKMRYLALFQNSNEMRPTGGFIGSFALVDIYRGEIESIEVPGGGPYEINTFLKEKVIAPEPLHLVNPHWYIQDANWFPDWPTSAKKIIWFYENSGGPSVDGVLTFTPQVLQELLKVTGPIAMAGYQVTVDHNNFVDVTQNIVEVEYDKQENKPKQFIADLLPKVLDQAFSGEALAENGFALLKAFHQSLNQKNILLYFQDEYLQDKAVELGWAGEIKEAPADYLMVINTNIAGGKTDGVIDEFIDHRAEIQSNGQIVNTVSLQRTHRGDPNDQFSGLVNVDYIRFYVPEGSELISIEGYETIDPWRFQAPDSSYELDETLLSIEQESIIDEITKTRISNQFGKTVFGNWLAVAPGESATLTIKYKLPFTIDQETDRYSLYAQKQPGSFGSYLNSQIIIPPEYRAIWAYPENILEVSQNQSIFQHDLVEDQFFGLVLKK